MGTLLGRVLLCRSGLTLGWTLLGPILNSDTQGRKTVQVTCVHPVLALPAGRLREAPCASICTHGMLWSPVICKGAESGQVERTRIKQKLTYADSAGR